MFPDRRTRGLCRHTNSARATVGDGQQQVDNKAIVVTAHRTPRRMCMISPLPQLTDSRCGLHSQERTGNNHSPVFVWAPCSKKFAAAMLAVSRRFKVRTNLVTIPRRPDRDTQGQQVANRDIPSRVPSRPSAAPIDPSALQTRPAMGHCRTSQDEIPFQIHGNSAFSSTRPSLYWFPPRPRFRDKTQAGCLG